MPKIKVFVTIKNNIDNVVLKNQYDGFLNNEKLVYQEEERIVTIYEESNTIRMIRREKENSTFLTFKDNVTTKGTYEIVGYRPLEIEISTSLLEKKDTSYHICYQTKVDKDIMGDFEVTIYYEVIG